MQILRSISSVLCRCCTASHLYYADRAQHLICTMQILHSISSVLCRSCTASHLYYPDPAQRVITAGQDLLDDLGHSVPDGTCRIHSRCDRPFLNTRGFVIHQNSVELENMYFELNIMKPINSPTQGQPNPRKITLKVAVGPLFFTHSNQFFSGLGLVLDRKQASRNPTQPNSPQTP